LYASKIPILNPITEDIFYQYSFRFAKGGITIQARPKRPLTARKETHEADLERDSERSPDEGTPDEGRRQS
jgi:hypothetical protein